jgi:phosphatidylglycerol:prolipoprotein diacylglycerol transferase
MHPVLFQLGPLTVHTYGFLIAVGFLVAVQVTKRLAAKAQLDIDRVLDLTFWSLLVGYSGSRLLFVITRLDLYLADPLGILRIWEGGGVFLGGPIAVLPFVIWYTRKHKLPVWRVMDVLGPGLVIAHVIGRFGCIAAGCCYGKPTGADWGLRFDSPLVDLSLRGIPLHPTQLYEAGALFVLFLGMLWVHKRKVFDGQVALTYLMGYPVIRSVIEEFRGDTVRGFVIDGLMSTSQFLSSLIFLGALVTLIYRLRALDMQKQKSESR